MKRPELLAPAGNMESLKAALLAGCDAVYLGGYQFGARSFAGNFSNEELIEAIDYCHLYGVKVYVTVNTLIYEHEVPLFIDYVDFLYQSGVDALIIQDIGMVDLVRQMYPNLDIHASTQMHIHNLEGVRFVQGIGVKRAVIARETDIDTIADIKRNVDIELEVFVHGALCISYSGQCLMSSLIGGRSGNRGSCAGSCRQRYDFVTNENGKYRVMNENAYLMSTKDLNSLERVGDLIDIGVDSFKIEGRMKSPVYVYTVVSLYRKAIDSYLECGKVTISEDEILKLKKIFYRGFTKGFLFHEENGNIVNAIRPNHLGVLIGKVIGVKGNRVEILLSSDLHVQDGIRILQDDEDVGGIVTSIFCKGKKVEEASSDDVVTIVLNHAVKVGGMVLKTTDYLLQKEVNSILKVEKRVVPVDIHVSCMVGKPIMLQISDGEYQVECYGSVVEEANQAPLTQERILEQVSKLGNTIYRVRNSTIESDSNVFLSIHALNELRREAVLLFHEKRAFHREVKKGKYHCEVPDFDISLGYSVLVHNERQYELVWKYPFCTIYVDDMELYSKLTDKRVVYQVDRVMKTYPDYAFPMLVGEFGGLCEGQVFSDFSFNVVNSYSVAFLHRYGVKRVTLSYELDETQVSYLMQGYMKRYGKYPNVEFVCYGKEEAMVCKYNLFHHYDVSNGYLKDRFSNLYPVVSRDGIMHIYHYRARDIKNYHDYFSMGVACLRFSLLDEEDESVCISIFDSLFPTKTKH